MNRLDDSRHLVGIVLDPFALSKHGILLAVSGCGPLPQLLHFLHALRLGEKVC